MGKVYLAGPIDNCDAAQVFDWRQQASVMLGAGNVLDPTRRDYRNRLLTNEVVADIVSSDINDIYNSSVVLANMWRLSCGTSMELVYASGYMKPVVTVFPLDSEIPVWLRYHSNIVVKTLRGAIEWIGERGYVN